MENVQSRRCQIAQIIMVGRNVNTTQVPARVLGVAVLFVHGRTSRIPLGHAGALSGSVTDMTVETWMNEWMSVSKAPGGVLKISRFREPIYFLIAPISWKPNPGQETYEAVNVPTGFVTDFASIPRVFWSVLRPDGEYAYAAVVHDYLYWTQTRSREEADQILKMAMEDFDVGTTSVSTIFHAVRVRWRRRLEE